MSFTSRIRTAFRPVREDERAHAYLSEATSLVDLERRQREIDQGLLRRRSYPF